MKSKERSKPRARTFYPKQESYLEYSNHIIESAKKNGRISDDDEILIIEFMNERDAEGISPIRHYKLVCDLIAARDYFPPFKECSIADLHRAIQKIKTDVKPDGKPKYKQNTVSDKIRITKRFFIWLADNGYSDIEKSKLQKIRAPAYSKNTVTSNSILSEEEVERFLEACKTPRDKAFFFMLYEGAFRVGELGDLKFRDVFITDKILKITTDKKTKKVRHVPLILSRQYYINWVNSYPGDASNPDNYVFVNQYGNPLSWLAISKRIKLIKEAAGIEKDLHAHIFRHSRITHLLQQNMPEAHLKLMAWGDVNTDMLSVYQHLTDKDIEESLARINHISLLDEVPGEVQHKRRMKPIVCSHCGTINSPTTYLCSKCGAPLTEEGKMSIDNLMDHVFRQLLDSPSLMCEAMERARKNMEQRKEY